MKPASTDRKPTRDRSNKADRRLEREPREPRERRSGEGSESALANLKSIELDRRKTTPVEDPNSD